jgi:hypothetical protein
VEKNKVLRCIDLRNNALTTETGGCLVLALLHNAKALLALRLEGNPRIRLQDRRKIERQLRKQKLAYAGEVVAAHLSKVAMSKKIKKEAHGHDGPAATSSKPWDEALTNVLRHGSAGHTHEVETPGRQSTAVSYNGSTDKK